MGAREAVECNLADVSGQMGSMTPDLGKRLAAKCLGVLVCGTPAPCASERQDPYRIHRGALLPVSAGHSPSTTTMVL